MPSDKRQRVLVVDDTPENIEVLRQTLRDDYAVMAAIKGEKALNIARGPTPPDLILLDIMMPGMDGYEVCRRLKADPATRDIPVIFVTALNETGNEAQGLELGAADYIRKPFEPILVHARVHNHLELKRHRQELEDLVAERTRELVLTQDVTVEAMASLAEYRDPDTGGHIKRTQHYVRRLAEHLQHHPDYRDYLTADTIRLLYQSAPLHDIGKVAVPDKILLKPGRLTDDEFAIMKRHVEYGANALAVAEHGSHVTWFLSLAQDIILGHHEKWDGSGYPNGLAGDAIPIGGRLMALADVYDALISRRCYKEPFSHHHALEIIREGVGKHFDPQMAETMLEIADDFKQIAERYKDRA